MARSTIRAPWKIFEKCLERVVGMPNHEHSDTEVGVASPPAPAPVLASLSTPSLAPTRVSPPAVAPARIPTRRHRFRVGPAGGYAFGRLVCYALGSSARNGPSSSGAPEPEADGDEGTVGSAM